MNKTIAFFSLLVILIISCQRESKVEKEIAQIPVSIEVDPFYLKFSNASPEDLPSLKEKYSFLFPASSSDAEWIEMMSDTIQMELEEEVKKHFPTLNQQEKELKALFQHLKYYDSTFTVPRVIGLISRVDYESRVIVTDSLLLLSLDNYLGEKHHFYSGIQNYYRKNFKKSQILPDVAAEYAEKYVPRPKERDFMEYMVYYGKLQFFKQTMLPGYEESSILGYTEDEYAWAEANQRQIWGYFVENSLLYDTDPELRRKFFDLGPFTKFGLHLDNESPPQLGQYIGLQIVKQYQAKHKIDLMKLLQMDNKTLFKESNYKPKQS